MEETNTTPQNSGNNNHPDESSASGASIAKTTAQSSVILVYNAKIYNTIRKVTIVWNKTLINHSLSISITRSTSSFDPPSCRIDLKPWPFWSKKGFKSLDIGDHRIDLFWDLRSAKFAGGNSPEPSASYYVALVGGSEVLLFLGDLKKKAYKRTRARPSLHDAAMILKKENVFGKRSFKGRTSFKEGKREHEIVVESSITGGNGKDCEMWISVDGIVMIHVSNLQWKFRGNETLMVESSPVQVFWDVHDWFYGGEGIGRALFIFRAGVAEKEVTVVEETSGSEESWWSEEGGKKVALENEIVGGGGAAANPSSEFCYMLCAWRVDK